MNKKRIAAAAQVVGLTVIVAFLIAHTAWWHADGEHTRIFEGAQNGGELKAVLYNLALMVVTGGAVGLLLMRATAALGYDIPEIEHFPQQVDGTDSGE